MTKATFESTYIRFWYV